MNMTFEYSSSLPDNFDGFILDLISDAIDVIVEGMDPEGGEQQEWGIIFEHEKLVNLSLVVKLDIGVWEKEGYEGVYEGEVYNFAFIILFGEGNAYEEKIIFECEVNIISPWKFNYNKLVAEIEDFEENYEKNEKNIKEAFNYILRIHDVINSRVLEEGKSIEENILEEYQSKKQEIQRLQDRLGELKEEERGLIKLKQKTWKEFLEKELG